MEQLSEKPKYSKSWYKICVPKYFEMFKKYVLWLYWSKDILLPIQNRISFIEYIGINTLFFIST